MGIYFPARMFVAGIKNVMKHQQINIILKALYFMLLWMLEFRNILYDDLFGYFVEASINHLENLLRERVLNAVNHKLVFIECL